MSSMPLAELGLLDKQGNYLLSAESIVIAVGTTLTETVSQFVVPQFPSALT